MEFDILCNWTRNAGICALSKCNGSIEVVEYNVFIVYNLSFLS